MTFQVILLEHSLLCGGKKKVGEEAEKRGWRRDHGGIFIDNKRWDALVSAWPTEPDDRHAA